MLLEEIMEVDLSIVKKEKLELEDYGQNTGNILDNFLSEHDYNSFPESVPTVPCEEDEDVNVDWLSSFFDEPIHDNMSGLNPPLSDIASTHCTPSISKMTSINGGGDNLFFDSLSTFTEDYINNSSLINESNSIKSLPSPTLGKSNPLLSQTKPHTTNTLNLCKNQNYPVKIEENNNINMSSKATEMEVDKHFSKTEKQNQQKLLLFMNTPENRAKLAGTNFNIINANLLSKISGQTSNTEKSRNVINLKKCIKLNNNIKTEELQYLRQEDVTAANTFSKFGQNSINGILQTNVLQGLMKVDKENQEVDSGYESPSSSSGSSPCSPPIDLDRRDSYNSCETLQYIDIPPHERQPFYLSEEEKRTLIIEGLPVPTGLPLNKMEERALKKVRRKIKNKISAQESRRKKKEYMEALEKKVDSYASENNGLKKKVNSLEVANRSLIIQVQKLQALVATKVGKNVGTVTKCNQTDEMVS